MRSHFWVATAGSTRLDQAGAWVHEQLAQSDFGVLSVSAINSAGFQRRFGVSLRELDLSWFCDHFRLQLFTVSKLTRTYRYIALPDFELGSSFKNVYDFLTFDARERMREEWGRQTAVQRERQYGHLHPKMGDVVNVQVGREKIISCIAKKFGQCRDCDRLIVWAVTENGRNMPLNPTAKQTGAYICHFATCRKSRIKNRLWRRDRKQQKRIRQGA